MYGVAVAEEPGGGWIEGLINGVCRVASPRWGGEAGAAAEVVDGESRCRVAEYRRS